MFAMCNKAINAPQESAKATTRAAWLNHGFGNSAPPYENQLLLQLNLNENKKLRMNSISSRNGNIITPSSVTPSKKSPSRNSGKSRNSCTASTEHIIHT
jgi:hypothetical protein